MPERTKDRKWWFSRFKSSELGNFRGKVRTHPCCECAQPLNATTGLPTPYKGVEGTHCNCGRDAWRAAMHEERDEYLKRTAALEARGVEVKQRMPKNKRLPCDDEQPPKNPKRAAFAPSPSRSASLSEAGARAVAAAEATPMARRVTPASAARAAPCAVLLKTPAGTGTAERGTSVAGAGADEGAGTDESATTTAPKASPAKTRRRWVRASPAAAAAAAAAPAAQFPGLGGPWAEQSAHCGLDVGSGASFFTGRGLNVSLAEPVPGSAPAPAIAVPGGGVRSQMQRPLLRRLETLGGRIELQGRKRAITSFTQAAAGCDDVTRDSGFCHGYGEQQQQQQQQQQQPDSKRPRLGGSGARGKVASPTGSLSASTGSDCDSDVDALDAVAAVSAPSSPRGGATALPGGAGSEPVPLEFDVCVQANGGSVELQRLRSLGGINVFEDIGMPGGFDQLSALNIAM
eukprot:g4674.t1